MTPVYIALGSNLGNPEVQLRRAVTALETLPDTQLDQMSGVYRSVAVGPKMQPDYLNAVIQLATKLSPTNLLDALQKIEQDQDRIRDERWGPRTLDLDILLYGDLQVASERLTIPHPLMQERDFVLYPLREISNTNLVLPDGTDIGTLLRQCPDNGLVRTNYQLRATQPTQSD
jgi:2-amino-4-hydroxy-6-hydroxymethyldihydropteridine diphosphokinase